MPFLIVLAASLIGGATVRDELQVIADDVRSKNGLPCLILGIRKEDKTYVVASGTVANGNTQPVTPDSHVHIGSNTKAMTAVLVAREVEAGTVQWTTTVGKLFPDLKIPEQIAGCSFLDLLSHTSGLSSSTYPGRVSWHTLKDSEFDQHVEFLSAMATLPLRPKGQFNYANGNYVIAAAMLEKATGKSYSELMRKDVFSPLDMASASFGPPLGNHDPWPHVTHNGQFVPVDPAHPKPGTVSDNAPVVSPAGRINISLADQLKFAGLFWGSAPRAFLSPQSLTVLETSRSPEGYALGWQTLDRSWGGGTVLTHNGSNTMNYETIWVAPKRHLAVIAFTNVAGDPIHGILDQAISRSILAVLR